MKIFTILLTAIALSMDSMSLAISYGLCTKDNLKKELIKVSLIFGFFQFIMSLIGFFIGSLFLNKISIYFNYISFFIFFILGITMLKDGINKDKNSPKLINSLNIFQISLLGLASSVDALLVGFTFSLIPYFRVFLYSLLIGSTTFILSALGFYLSNKFGNFLGKRANIIAFLILIIVSINILL